MIRITILSLILLGSLLGLSIFFQKVIVAFLITLVPLFIILLLNAERINILSGKKIGVPASLKGLSLAVVFGLIIPSRISEAIKPIYYHKTRGIPIFEGSSITIIERFFDVLALLSLAIISSFLLSAQALEGSLNPVATAVFIAVILLGATWLVTHLRSLDFLLTFIPFKHFRVYARKTIRLIRKSLITGLSTWQILLTMIIWSGSALCYWIFFQFDGAVALNVNQTLTVFVIATLGVNLTVTPGGVGTFEAAVAFTLQSFGYDLDQALASSLGLRLITFIPPSCIVLYMIVIDGIDVLALGKRKEK